jgi:hypothetical protein
MIRARLSNGSFLLGLDAENIRRLTSGKPILVDLFGMGGTDRFMITYGETLDDIKAELEAATGKPLPPSNPFVDPDKGQTS